MSLSTAGSEIERLIQLLAKLPGLGPRSARRAALHLVKKREQLLGPLAEAMEAARRNIVVCEECGNVDTVNPCAICRDPRRDSSIVVVVEDVGDLWALERSSAILARYHVLGGVLSAMDGVRPENLSIDKLIERASADDVKELILALNATVDGATTAHYITDRLAHLPLRITRLAHGVPVGGELDYLDDGTLSAAIRQRTGF
jgi:recombination protein RecR